MSYASDGDIATYADLQAAIADWLARADLTASIKAFIKLGEASIKREVRDKTLVAAVTLDAATETLPATVGELRDIYLTTTNNKHPLEIVTPSTLAEKRGIYGDTTGTPVYASLIEGVLYLVPTPSEATPAEIVFFEKLQPLTNANTTNSILTDAPDVYLYGSLLHAAPFLEHDTRIPVWEKMYKAGVSSLNLERENQEYGAGFRKKRLPPLLP